MASAITTRSPETTGSSVRGAVESLYRHKRVFLSVFCFCLLLTLLYVFVSHKRYESDMSLLIENNRKPEVISSEATTGGSAIVNQVSEDQLYSQIEILGSADVLDEVVDPGWRSVPVTQHSRPQQAMHESKVSKLRAHLIVSPVRKSDVIDVSFTANDPRVATDTLNRVLAIYLVQQQKVNQPAGASHFFSDQAERYQKEWSVAQQQLADFQQNHQVVSVAEKESDLSKALADTMTLLRASEAEIAEVSHRLQVVSSQLASTPTRERTIERVLPASGSIDQINTLLAQLVLRRAQLLTEYLPTDRLVQQVDSQIAEAQTELSRSQGMRSMELQSSVNPKWQAQDQSIADDQAHLRAATARRDTIASQVADLETQLKGTERDTLEFTTLQQKVATLNSNYQTYVQKRDAATISEAMDTRGLLNVGVAQSPTFSLYPVRPRPLIDTLLGLLTSFFLASFAVYLAESGRETIATPAELDVASHYPVLATVGYGANTSSGEHLSPRAARSILGALRHRAAEARSQARR